MIKTVYVTYEPRCRCQNSGLLCTKTEVFDIKPPSKPLRVLYSETKKQNEQPPSPLSGVNINIARRNADSKPDDRDQKGENAGDKPDIDTGLDTLSVDEVCLFVEILCVATELDKRLGFRQGAACLLGGGERLLGDGRRLLRRADGFAHARCTLAKGAKAQRASS